MKTAVLLALAAVSGTQAMTLLTLTAYTTAADCSGAPVAVQYAFGAGGGQPDGLCTPGLGGLTSTKLDCSGKKFNTYASGDCSGTPVTVTLDTCINGAKYTCTSQPGYKLSIFNGTADANCANTPFLTVYGSTSCQYATAPIKFSTNVKHEGANFNQYTYPTSDCSGTASATVVYPAACSAFAAIPLP